MKNEIILVLCICLILGCFEYKYDGTYTYFGQVEDIVSVGDGDRVLIISNGKKLVAETFAHGIAVDDAVYVYRDRGGCFYGIKIPDYVGSLYKRFEYISSPINEHKE